jgi:hypothetical protein
MAQREEDEERWKNRSDKQKQWSHFRNNCKLGWTNTSVRRNLLLALFAALVGVLPGIFSIVTGFRPESAKWADPLSGFISVVGGLVGIIFAVYEFVWTDFSPSAANA